MNRRGLLKAFVGLVVASVTPFATAFPKKNSGKWYAELTVKESMPFLLMRGELVKFEGVRINCGEEPFIYGPPVGYIPMNRSPLAGFQKGDVVGLIYDTNAGIFEALK